MFLRKICKIKLLFYLIKNKVKNTFIFIKTINKWMPIILNDTNDFSSIYMMLYYKLKFLEYHFRDNNGKCFDNNKIADEIMMVKSLSKRLYDDNYLDYSYKTHKNFTERYGRLNEHDSKQFTKSVEMSDYTKNQDKEELFKYLNKNIEKWY